jgi:hypothetical protein
MFGKRQLNRGRLSKLSLSCLAVAIAISLAMQTWSAFALEPVTLASGFEITRGQRDSVFWVNSTKLLFAGMKEADMRAAVGAKISSPEARLKKLYLWDLSSPTAQVFADAKAVCFSDGLVRYAVLRDEAAGKSYFREGPFGAEREVVESTKPLPKDIQKNYVRNNFECHATKLSELVPVPPRNRRVILLRNKDGYLDVGPDDPIKQDSSASNLILYQPKRQEGVRLSVTRKEDVAVSRSEYRGAYVLRPASARGADSRTWPKNLPLVVYLLWPDGRIESTSIPYQPSEYLIDPQPVAAGWIFGGGNFYKSSGLYFFDGKSVTKLEMGLVHKIAVSPDGCKAAVGIQSKHLEMGTPVALKIIEFCKGMH